MVWEVQSHPGARHLWIVQRLHLPLNRHYHCWFNAPLCQVSQDVAWPTGGFGIMLNAKMLMMDPPAVNFYLQWGVMLAVSDNFCHSWDCWAFFSSKCLKTFRGAQWHREADRTGYTLRMVKQRNYIFSIIVDFTLHKAHRTAFRQVTTTSTIIVLPSNEALYVCTLHSV